MEFSHSERMLLRQVLTSRRLEYDKNEWHIGSKTNKGHVPICQYPLLASFCFINNFPLEDSHVLDRF